MRSRKDRTRPFMKWEDLLRTTETGKSSSYASGDEGSPGEKRNPPPGKGIPAKGTYGETERTASLAGKPAKTAGEESHKETSEKTDWSRAQESA